METSKMRLAVSSIGWSNDEEPVIAETLAELGVNEVELAPTKLWDDPTKVGQADAQAVSDWWLQRNITPVAFQSMLFARPDLKLFESDANRQACLQYLKDFITLAGHMGVKRMVFGSPKNRQRDNLPYAEAFVIAKDFFSELGKKAAKHDVVFCIEPNAPQYNCDFVTTAAEGAELVAAVNSPGFGLHLDTACMTLAGDNLSESIRTYKNLIEHFHISAPMLGDVSIDDGIDHAAAAAALREVGYNRTISIEMRPGENDTNRSRVETAVHLAQSIYLS